MANSKYKPNKLFSKVVMNGSKCQAKLLNVAHQVRDTAGYFGTATYAANVQPGKTRAHAIVYTPSMHAIYSNAKHKSLIKAIRTCREG